MKFFKFAEEIISNILKKAMPLSDAYRVFEIPFGTTIDVDFLKKKYRELALSNHPDKGGDLEKMKRINDAKDTLDRHLEGGGTSWGGGSSYQRQDSGSRWDSDDAQERAERRKREEEEQKRQEAEFARRNEERKRKTEEDQKKTVEKMEDMKKYLATAKNDFINHVARYSGKTPQMYVKSRAGDSGMVTLEYKLRSDDGTEFTLSIQRSEQAGVAKFYYDSNVFFNRKLYKMQKSRTLSVNELSFFVHPENIFPKTKLKKIFEAKPAGEGDDKKKTTFRRKDAEAILEKEFFAKYIDKDRWRINLKDDRYVIVYRTTILRQAAWNIAGLFEKYKRIATTKIGGGNTYMETLEKISGKNFEDFLLCLKDIKDDKYEWNFTTRY